MFRLAEQEVQRETAELDVAARHRGAGQHDRGHGLEGVRAQLGWMDAWLMDHVEVVNVLEALASVD